MVRGPRDENVLSTGVRIPIRPCNVNLPRRMPRPIDTGLNDIAKNRRN